jgi:hypothetical protein
LLNEIIVRESAGLLNSIPDHPAAIVILRIGAINDQPRSGR